MPVFLTSFRDSTHDFVHLCNANFGVILGLFRHSLTSFVLSVEELESCRAHVVDLSLESFEDSLDTLEDWIVFDASGSSSAGFVFIISRSI